MTEGEPAEARVRNEHDPVAARDQAARDRKRENLGLLTLNELARIATALERLADAWGAPR